MGKKNYKIAEEKNHPTLSCPKAIVLDVKLNFLSGDRRARSASRTAMNQIESGKSDITLIIYCDVGSSKVIV